MVSTTGLRGLWMFRRLIELILGKPSVREQHVAKQIKRMFEDAERDGYEIVVDRAGIHRRRKVE